MNCRNALEKIMKEHGITQVELADMVGYRGQTSISGALQRDMKISTLYMLVDAMGYDLVLIDRESKIERVGMIQLDDSPYVPKRRLSPKSRKAAPAVPDPEQPEQPDAD